MKTNLIIILCLFNFAKGGAEDINAIVKANVIKGESMTTLNIKASEIEQIFIAALSTKGIKSNDEQAKKNLYIDIFLFQFPGDFITVSVTVRTKKGIHFVDWERTLFSFKAHKEYFKLAKKLAERLPNIFDQSFKYSLSTDNIISRNQSINLTQITTNAILESYRKNYNNILEWNENSPIPFIVNDFDQYLSYCINYEGFRKKVKNLGSITLHLKIDNDGHTIIERIDAPFELNDKERMRLEKQFLPSQFG
ncbi:MAG: hypothetical protein IPH57_07690 [Saprospiraceae bacterium]|nr:hypothetical protein [Saprospiraceae bacterium]